MEGEMLFILSWKVCKGLPGVSMSMFDYVPSRIMQRRVGIRCWEVGMEHSILFFGSHANVSRHFWRSKCAWGARVNSSALGSSDQTGTACRRQREVVVMVWWVDQMILVVFFNLNGSMSVIPLYQQCLLDTVLYSWRFHSCHYAAESIRQWLPNLCQSKCIPGSVQLEPPWVTPCKKHTILHL